jgi:hypothetical protein
MEEKKGFEIECIVNVPVRIRHGVLGVPNEQGAYDKLDEVYHGNTEHLWDVLTFPDRHGTLGIDWKEMKFVSIVDSKKIIFTEGIGMRYE